MLHTVQNAQTFLLTFFEMINHSKLSYHFYWLRYIPLGLIRKVWIGLIHYFGVHFRRANPSFNEIGVFKVTAVFTNISVTVMKLKNCKKLGSSLVFFQINIYPWSEFPTNPPSMLSQNVTHYSYIANFHTSPFGWVQYHDRYLQF